MVAEAKKAAVDRVDEVEKKLNRMRLSAGVGDDELKLAREFAETKAKLNKTLKPGEELADDAVDVAEFKAYSGAFRRMISNRQGVQGLSLDEQKHGRESCRERGW